MPWTLWLILTLIFLAFDTLVRYLRLRDSPAAWTPRAAAIGASLWGVAWIVLSLGRGPTALIVLQTALFCVLYMAVVVLLGRRLLAGR